MTVYDSIDHFEPPNTRKQLARTGLRYGLALVFGISITVLLFYVMQSLIKYGEQVMNEEPFGVLVDFIRVKEEQELMVKKRKAEPPPLPDEPPPEIAKPEFDISMDTAGWSEWVPLKTEQFSSSGPMGFITDGNYLPIVKVQPVYPVIALTKGLFGWVIVEFTVSEQGMVMDPAIVSNCVMRDIVNRELECYEQPGKIFDRAAIKAAAKFKYKPRVIDGIAVATIGVRNKITFELAD